jgi:hypothetical protein
MVERKADMDETHNSHAGKPDENEIARQLFLDRAKHLSKLSEGLRWPLVSQLLCEAAGRGVHANAEILETAYGDATGREYFEGLLSEPISVRMLARVLEGLLDHGVPDMELVILRAFKIAAENGQHWFIGKTDPLLAMKEGQESFEELETVKVNPRPAIEWLLSKPRRKFLVSESLRQYLQSDLRGKSDLERRDELRQASGKIIHDEIAAAYDAAEVAGEKPPNVKEIQDIVLRRLQGKGLTASKRQIEGYADVPEFKSRRLPPGATLRSKKRTDAK